MGGRPVADLIERDRADHSMRDPEARTAIGRQTLERRVIFPAEAASAASASSRRTCGGGITLRDASIVCGIGAPTSDQSRSSKSAGSGCDGSRPRSSRRTPCPRAATCQPICAADQPASGAASSRLCRHALEPRDEPAMRLVVRAAQLGDPFARARPWLRSHAREERRQRQVAHRVQAGRGLRAPSESS